MVCYYLFNNEQGENVDALVNYIGEDPKHCPFEQGLEQKQQMPSSFVQYIGKWFIVIICLITMFGDRFLQLLHPS